MTFANLQSQGNEADIDGTVTAWNAATNNTVDAIRLAFWTPAANANGLLNAFTVVAKDNGGLESATAIQAKANLTAVNDAPVLTQPTTITYTDTVFDDTFATAADSLLATDIDLNALTYSIAGGTDDGLTISKSSAFGVLTVTKANGAYSFVANDTAIEALTAGTSANFTVTTSDGVLSDSKTLTINITQNGITESIGNDTLTGTPGNNKFNGLAGADTMIGGLGNDIYVVDNVNDVVTETSALARELTGSTARSVTN